LPNRIRVAVPATSANLGPGFDCLGLALSLHNIVEIEEIEQGLEIEINGEGSQSFPKGRGNSVVRAAYKVFDLIGHQPGGLCVTTTNNIPAGSGLGSSAAALVGGLVAANKLLGESLGRDQILNLAVELEGHPDNVSAALLGGLVMSSYTDDGLAARRVAVAPMEVAVALPDVRTSTRELRAALPTQVLMKDAVANIGRAVLVVEALREGDFDLLGQVMKDRLHEPYRRKTIPGFQRACNAAYEAGASAVAISGAGPSVIAFAPANLDRIAEAMEAAFRQAGQANVRRWVLPVDMQGARVKIQAS